MYGTSGGALTGCLLFLDIDLDALAEYVFICVAKARSSWRGKFLLREYCRGAIEQFCTRDAHKILQGRFEISITRIFPWYKNLRVNQFPSYEFLVRALLCSACLVPLAGLPMWLPGYGLCFDGGVSDFQLFKGLARNGTFCKLHCRKTNPKDIVVVCPFYSSRADIRPSKFVPIWWAFFPPEPYKLKELFELGQKDAHAWADKQEEKTPEGSPRSAEAEAARAGAAGGAEPASARARAAARRSRRGRRAMTASRATGSGAAARRRPPRRRGTAPRRVRRRGAPRGRIPTRGGGPTARGRTRPRGGVAATPTSGAARARPRRARRRRGRRVTRRIHRPPARGGAWTARAGPSGRRGAAATRRRAAGAAGAAGSPSGRRSARSGRA